MGFCCSEIKEETISYLMWLCVEERVSIDKWQAVVQKILSNLHESKQWLLPLTHRPFVLLNTELGQH
jgi:hypothetical protein